jgi:hypothetical protein
MLDRVRGQRGGCRTRPPNGPAGWSRWRSTCGRSTPHELDNLWEIRHAASPLLARLGEGPARCRSRTAAFHRPGWPRSRALRAIAARHGVPVVLFGHAGDANVHANLLVDIRQPDWELRVRAVFDDASCAQIALGGTPAGEHGAGRLRAGLLPRVYGREIVGLFAAVKQAFDPEGMMNPRVILPAPMPDHVQGRGAALALPRTSRPACGTWNGLGRGTGTGTPWRRLTRGRLRRAALMRAYLDLVRIWTPVPEDDRTGTGTLSIFRPDALRPAAGFPLVTTRSCTSSRSSRAALVLQVRPTSALQAAGGLG